ACIPATALAVLADVRCAPHVRVTLVGGQAWVRWRPGDPEVLARLLPVSGAKLYANRGGLWYQPRCHLPAFGLPVDAPSKPLYAVLTPAPFEVLRPGHFRVERRAVALVCDCQRQDTTAEYCELAALADWAEHATTAQLSRLRGAMTAHDVLLRGEALPLLPA